MALTNGLVDSIQRTLLGCTLSEDAAFELHESINQCTTPNSGNVTFQYQQKRTALLRMLVESSTSFTFCSLDGEDYRCYFETRKNRIRVEVIAHTKAEGIDKIIALLLAQM